MPCHHGCSCPIASKPPSWHDKHRCARTPSLPASRFLLPPLSHLRFATSAISSTVFCFNAERNAYRPIAITVMPPTRKASERYTRDDGDGRTWGQGTIHARARHANRAIPRDRNQEMSSVVRIRVTHMTCYMHRPPPFLSPFACNILRTAAVVSVA